MIRVTLLLVVLIGLAACDSRQERSPGPTPPSPVASVNASVKGVITVGQELRDAYRDIPLFYELTAPSDGSLVVRLSWDHLVNGGRLKLTLVEISFLGSAPDWSPVVGRVAVLAGHKYRVGIDEGHSPWDYGSNVPFVLITAIE